MSKTVQERTPKDNLATQTACEAYDMIAAGLCILPTKRDNPKHLRLGFTHDTEPTASDFDDGYGIATLSGLQRNGLYLNIIDDDTPDTRYYEMVRQYAFKNQIVRTINIAHAESSTNGREHMRFYTPFRVISGTLPDGKSEWKCEEPNGGHNKATFTVANQEYDNDWREIPTLDEAMVKTLQDMFGYVSKAQPEVTWEERATYNPPSNSGCTAVDIRIDFNYNADPIAELTSRGFIYTWRSRNGDTLEFQCNCGAHSSTPETAKRGGIVVRRLNKGWLVMVRNGACTWGSLNKKWLLDFIAGVEGLDFNGFIKAHFSHLLPDRIATPRTISHNVSQITPLSEQTKDQEKDAERKRTERAEVAAAEMELIRAYALNHTWFKRNDGQAGMLQFLELLLSEGLQSTHDNKYYAEILNTCTRTITRYFKAIKGKIGERTEGLSPNGSYDTYVIPTWTFYRVTDNIPQPPTVEGSNVPQPLENYLSTPIIPQQEAEVEYLSTYKQEYKNTGNTEQGKEEKTDVALLSSLVPCDAATAIAYEGGASYDPAAAAPLSEGYRGRTRRTLSPG